MTISPAQLAANRANALKSSGPRTVEGKAVSRMNAFRHGLAGSGDLVGPDEDLDLELVEHRTKAFTRELEAPGGVGALFAHRAAVLSVRMERAAVRELVAVETNVRAAHAEFDAERAATLRDWTEALASPVDPRPALLGLAAMPEGVAWLRDAWITLRPAVVAGDPVATARAAHWLGWGEEADATATGVDLIPRIDAEVVRLRTLAESAPLREAALIVAVQRDEAGLIASFDPSPEATLARRYEDAAERNFYRAIRAIRDLRRTQSPDLLPVPLGGNLQATVAALRSVEPVTAPAPPTAEPMGSFCAGGFDPTRPPVPSFLDLLEPPILPPIHPNKRPDLRKLARNRR